MKIARENSSLTERNVNTNVVDHSFVPTTHTFLAKLTGGAVPVPKEETPNDEQLAVFVDINGSMGASPLQHTNAKNACIIFSTSVLCCCVYYCTLD